MHSHQGSMEFRSGNSWVSGSRNSAKFNVIFFIIFTRVGKDGLTEPKPKTGFLTKNENQKPGVSKPAASKTEGPDRSVFSLTYTP